MSGRQKNIFQFKQFSIRQDRSTHKVGTDGVLLGAWAPVENVKNVLDIGTGSGVIALMIAQRSAIDTKIDAIDLSEQESQQAKENVLNSPWPEKVNVIHSSLQEFQGLSYDLIVSNPPYFVNSAKPPSHERTRVRHTDSLKTEELLSHSKRLLKPDGKLCIILPFVEGLQFIDVAKKFGFHCTLLCEFQSRLDKPIERLLLQFEQSPRLIKKERLILYSEKENWSEDYINLTREFYLYI